MVTRSEKRRAIMIDLLIGLGIPLLQVLVRECTLISTLNHSFTCMAMAEYVVSGHRYNIFEDFGCTFAMVNMPPTYPLFFAWPIAIGCVSLYYCGEFLNCLRP